MGQVWPFTVTKWGDQQILSIKTNYKIQKKNHFEAWEINQRQYNNLRELMPKKLINLDKNSGNLAL